jgi:hypothetical protein
MCCGNCLEELTLVPASTYDLSADQIASFLHYILPETTAFPDAQGGWKNVARRISRLRFMAMFFSPTAPVTLEPSTQGGEDIC